MNLWIRRTRVALILFPAVLILPAGCPTATAPPDTFDVAVSATDKRSVARDTGPAELANSTWALFRKADPDESTTASDSAPGPYGGLLNGGLLARPPAGTQMFVADFGDVGQLTTIRENLYFLADIYGTEIPVGGSWSGSSIPGLEFRSASYGLQLGDTFGLAIVVNVRLNQTFVGRAIIYSWGTIASNEIDGTFGYLLDFSDGIGGLFLETGGDQYPFLAVQR